MCASVTDVIATAMRNSEFSSSRVAVFFFGWCWCASKHIASRCDPLLTRAFMYNLPSHKCAYMSLERERDKKMSNCRTECFCHYDVFFTVASKSWWPVACRPINVVHVICRICRRKTNRKTAVFYNCISVFDLIFFARFFLLFAGLLFCSNHFGFVLCCVLDKTISETKETVTQEMSDTKW